MNLKMRLLYVGKMMCFPKLKNYSLQMGELFVP